MPAPEEHCDASGDRTALAEEGQETAAYTDCLGESCSLQRSPGLVPQALGDAADITPCIQPHMAPIRVATSLSVHTSIPLAPYTALPPPVPKQTGATDPIQTQAEHQQGAQAATFTCPPSATDSCPRTTKTLYLGVLQSKGRRGPGALCRDEAQEGSQAAAHRCSQLRVLRQAGTSSPLDCTFPP